MAKIIPFENIDINKMSDDMFAKIKNDLMKSFRDSVYKNWEYSYTSSKKRSHWRSCKKRYNLTFEKANEIQLRQLDQDLGL